MQDQADQARNRLLTTLTDPATHPAAELVRLYHERWEIETADAELKSTILGGHVLRARTPDGVEQEVWALLTAYQALRTAMTDATDSIPGTDPDRAGFTTALAAARDQLVLAARHHHRHGHRPGRHHRPPRSRPSPARPTGPHQRPHRQTRDLQIQRTRTRHRPDHLQSHHQHQHAHEQPLTPPAPRLTERR
ncbi:transposase [Streptomyces sp. NPDC086010]|uniref:transposase n=1 Tax=Streptomyces sp. NPDC086010 TaxID=3365745 RepID=UPI0037D58FBD